MSAAQWVTSTVVVLAMLGVLFRPFRLMEAVFAVAGALLLVLIGSLPLDDAIAAIAKGTDVYLFLIGMMLLAELARAQGLFDWLAERAVRYAKGSPRRLFALIYAVGTVVTVFMSNDATAVVLTPAVYAAAKAARARPLPYLFVCAFIANAASFVLPISNPANLVVFGAHMPALPAWLARFGLPSLLSIGATFMTLRLLLREELRGDCASRVEPARLGKGAGLATFGIAVTVLALMTSSALRVSLGLPTFTAALLTFAAVLLWTREAPWRYLRHISFSIVPLVAGLFMLVAALDHAGLLAALSASFVRLADGSATQAAWLSGGFVALVSNLANNLPVGLLAGAAVQSAEPPARVADAILIGVDLGPNLSVAGSLATILWLAVLRREGYEIGAMAFLRLGCIVMPVALVLALAGLMLCS
jgi:arsenical pump membrane protein